MTAETRESDVVAIQLPGIRDYDQHHDTARQHRFLPRYEMYESTGDIIISDPVWGSERIGDWPGDKIFAEFFMHPVFRRLADIEQLTLPEWYATMPGTTGFTRWEHAWGSVVFVRQMIRQAEAEGREFTDREKLILQLRTFVSDAGHTAFSHLGDWLRQGYGGAEDSHDQELQDYLERAGVNDILRRHEIEPDEVIFPEVQDWVECPSPDLCVDRVDYGAREILRWVAPYSAEIWRNAFRLDKDNRLVMRNEEIAKYFGLCFGLLATEHWSHPTHRLQLQLFGDIVKGAVLQGSFYVDRAVHPIDGLYTTDKDILSGLRMVGTLNNDLHALLLDIGRAQRRIFAHGREKEIESYLARYEPRPHFGEPEPHQPFPHPLRNNGWPMEYSDVLPQAVEMFPISGQEEAQTLIDPAFFNIFLPALKPRAIDPPFMREGSICRVSEVDAHYAAALEEMRQIQSQPYLARIYMSPRALERLQKRLADVRAEWNQALARERSDLSRDQVVWSLGTVGLLAMARSAVDISTRY